MCCETPVRNMFIICWRTWFWRYTLTLLQGLNLYVVSIQAMSHDKLKHQHFCRTIDITFMWCRRFIIPKLSVWFLMRYWEQCTLWRHSLCYYVLWIVKIGSCALFNYRARYNAILFSDCTKELSLALFFGTAVKKLNDVIPCSITEQCIPSYILTVN